MTTAYDIHDLFHEYDELIDAGLIHRDAVASLNRKYGKQLGELLAEYADTHAGEDHD